MDAELRPVATAAVNFDKDLPSFQTHGGMHAKGSVVTAPPLMVTLPMSPYTCTLTNARAAPKHCQWVSALDMVLQRLQKEGLPFQHVRAVYSSRSGCLHQC